MFLCANNECRARCLPHDDSVDIKDLPNRFETQYILSCGHSLCEKCLYMVVARDERSLICDQCNTKTTFSARAYTSIKGCSLSNDTQINRINNGFATEIPIDAYSFGLAFCEELITASPVRTVTSPGILLYFLFSSSLLKFSINFFFLFSCFLHFFLCDFMCFFNR